MIVDKWGYTKINGIRVKAAKYEKRIRHLEHQNGRRGTIMSRRLGPPSAKSETHSATLTLFPPVGRQAYPRLAWITDCGVDVFRPGRVEGVPSCKRCRVNAPVRQVDG